MPRFALLFALLLPFSAVAQVLEVPVGQQGDPSQQQPRPADGQQAVASTSRLPATPHPALGDRPITRWYYPAFSVYFEPNRVIGSVLHPRPTPPAQGQCPFP